MAVIAPAPNVTAAGAAPIPAARGVLRGLAGTALAPSEKLGVAAWADKYRVMPAGSTQRPGPWCTDYVPYTRGIMDAWTDPRVTDIVVMKATQVGGTEIALNCIMHAIDADPGPILCLYPSADLAQDVNEQRFQPSVRSSPRVAKRLLTGGGRSDVKALQVRFDRCTVYFAGSNSEAATSSRPIRYVVGDEVSAAEFDPAAVDRAQERTRTWTRAKRLWLSKPAFFAQGIHELYLRSDQRSYHVPCPRCNEYQRLRFSRFRWEGGTAADPAEVRETAWYCCEHCQGRIEEIERRGMIDRGVWVPRGMRADREGRLHGQEAEHAGAAAGFHLPAILAPQVRFGDIAAKYVAARGLTQAFVNADLGEAWEEAADRVELGEVQAVREHARVRGHALVARGGKMPAGIISAVGGVDIQADRAYVAVWGFGPHGHLRRLLLHAVVPLPREGQGLDALDQLIDFRRGLAFTGDDQMPVFVAAWGVDSGDRTREVYQFAARHPHVCATKGRTGATMDRMVEVRVEQLARAMSRLRGAPTPGADGSFRFATYNADRYKDELYGQLRAAANNTPGARASDRLTTASQGTSSNAAAAAVGAGGPAGGAAGGQAVRVADNLIIPGGTGDEFLKHLTAEQLVRRTVRTPGGGQRTYAGWSIRPGLGDANHFLDATLIAFAVADAIGIQRTTEADYRAYRARLIRSQTGTPGGAAATGATGGEAVGASARPPVAGTPGGGAPGGGAPGGGAPGGGAPGGVRTGGGGGASGGGSYSAGAVAGFRPPV
jgi:phage terminase large subunit GpA-like protein